MLYPRFSFAVPRCQDSMSWVNTMVIGKHTKSCNCGLKIDTVFDRSHVQSNVVSATATLDVDGFKKYYFSSIE